MSVQSYLRQVRALRRKIFPLPKPERWVPTGVHLYQDDNGDYYFLPDQREIWERSQRAGITPNVYVNILPDEIGCCACEPSCDGSCSQKLWDAIDLASLERVPDEIEVA